MTRPFHAMQQVNFAGKAKRESNFDSMMNFKMTNIQTITLQIWVHGVFHKIFWFSTRVISCVNISTFVNRRKGKYRIRRIRLVGGHLD